MDRTEEFSARDAYRALAPIYDDFTAENDYELWLGQLLVPELERRGLRKGRLLDVGCGTGRAFAPMLDRGWEVVGCDGSAEMVELAGAKFPAVNVFVADACELPRLGSFELAWMLNDVANYLLGDDDLERALRGIRENLAIGGLVLFDCNSLALFRTNFVRDKAEEANWEWRWTGREEQVFAGGTFEAQISGEGVDTHVHRERHRPIEEAQEAMRAAGLGPLAALGQQETETGVVLLPNADEERDDKIVHIGVKAD